MFNVRSMAKIGHCSHSEQIEKPKQKHSFGHFRSPHVEIGYCWHHENLKIFRARLTIKKLC
jgi:hypothetical protein